MFKEELIKNYPEAIKFLTNAILKNKLANSYAFIGNNIDDIFSISKNLAKILNCEKNKELNNIQEPCETCINCRWLEKNEHPQAFITIKPDEKNKKEQIKIDDIRELLNQLAITSGFFRIIFFENSSTTTLTPECCNLLLKTIEEAQEKTVFIFANSSRNSILPTILSRSQTIYLSKKYSSISELGRYKNLQLSANNTKDILDYLEKNEMNLKDYLNYMAYTNYEKNKHLDQKNYCSFYKNLNTAYLKFKSFMQPKIIIEDL
ncbi:MAG: hypothetical protein HYY52_04840 [Candidatus Melainabacteria bacterium]|nr:hypothetical protein [Candidatus Melainabacteria bacterium]